MSILALVDPAALWHAVDMALSFFALGFVSLLLSIWPNLLPPDLSIWDAAAPPASQGFALVGTVIMLPAVLGYTWWSYSVFRGTVRVGSGYR